MERRRRVGKDNVDGCDDSSIVRVSVPASSGTCRRVGVSFAGRGGGKERGSGVAYPGCPCGGTSPQRQQGGIGIRSARRNFSMPPLAGLRLGGMRYPGFRSCLALSACGGLRHDVPSGLKRKWAVVIIPLVEVSAMRGNDTFIHANKSPITCPWTSVSLRSIPLW
jgi:hypothetical protein